MKPSLKNSNTARTVFLAFGISCLPAILSFVLAGGNRLFVPAGNIHVSQRARVVSSARMHRSHLNARRKLSEEISATAAYQDNAPAGAVWDDDMPVCVFVEDDNSGDEGGVMADDSNDSSAPVHGLFSNIATIAHVIGAQEILHQARTWFPSAFQGIYQSGAAPPSRGAKGNCQNAWHGGSGGGITIALRIIGGELSQNAQEWLGATEIREHVWRGVAKYAAHTCLCARMILQATACHFHGSNALESIP